MGRGRNQKSLSKLLDEIDIKLTSSSRAAAEIGDELLVYLLDMAILHVRKKAVRVAEAPKVNLVKSTRTLIAAE